jgi:hypothetical protein
MIVRKEKASKKMDFHLSLTPFERMRIFICAVHGNMRSTTYNVEIKAERERERDSPVPHMHAISLHIQQVPAVM